MFITQIWLTYQVSGIWEVWCNHSTLDINLKTAHSTSHNKKSNKSVISPSRIHILINHKQKKGSKQTLCSRGRQWGKGCCNYICNFLLVQHSQRKWLKQRTVWQKKYNFLKRFMYPLFYECIFLSKIYGPTHVCKHLQSRKKYQRHLLLSPKC